MLWQRTSMTKQVARNEDRVAFTIRMFYTDVSRKLEKVEGQLDKHLFYGFGTVNNIII